MSALKPATFSLFLRNPPLQFHEITLNFAFPSISFLCSEHRQFPSRSGKIAEALEEPLDFQGAVLCLGPIALKNKSMIGSESDG